MTPNPPRLVWLDAVNAANVSRFQRGESLIARDRPLHHKTLACQERHAKGVACVKQEIELTVAVSFPAILEIVTSRGLKK